MLPVPANSDLLSALNAADEQPNVFEIYCDLEFAFGRITTQLFFEISLEEAPGGLSVEADKWPEIKRKLQAVSAMFDKALLTPIDAVEQSYQEQLARFNSKINRERERKIRRLTTEVDDACSRLRHQAKRLREVLIASPTRDYRIYFSDQFVPELRIFAARFARTAEESVDLQPLKDVLTEWISRLRSGEPAGIELLSEALDAVKHLDAARSKLAAEQAARVPPPLYEANLDTRVINRALTARKIWVRKNIARFNQTPPTLSELRDFLTKSNEIFGLLDSMLTEPSIFPTERVIGTQKFVPLEQLPRLALSVHDVFDSGVDVCVFGEAGAGKSTTLQMYARRHVTHVDPNALALYLPLARVAATVSPQADRESVQPPADRLVTAILAYLRSRNIPITEPEFVRLIQSNRRSILILDGLDEVIERIPWITEAIDALKRRFPAVQLVMSSRMSGDYIRKVHAVGLTLLPFTDEQLDTFIRNWFGAPDKQKSDAIINHLRDPQNTALAQVVRNPLLATVVCVLAKQNVPLPGNEIGLYDERLRLLLGHYDRRKGVQRIRTHHSILDACARKLAFFLHEQHLRAASLETLVDCAAHRLRRLSRSEVETAVRELDEPCNILVPMTESGAYGFGHLRYQEYLAASEIKSNRGIDLEPLLIDSWWHDAMVLFAQMTDSVSEIIDQLVLSNRGPLSRASSTLKAMIAARPAIEQLDLLQMVTSHERLDRKEGWLPDLDDPLDADDSR